MAGDTARAESLAQNLGKRFPLDTQMQSLWLPAIQAQLALDKKNSTSALSPLQPASPIELGETPFGNNISCLYHVYVRGEAYLAAGQGSVAAAEFQKILDHSGIVWNCWTGALAHWEWLVPTPCSREPRRARTPMPPASGHSPPTKISSRSGKPATPQKKTTPPCPAAPTKPPPPPQPPLDGARFGYGKVCQRNACKIARLIRLHAGTTPSRGHRAAHGHRP